MVCILYDENEEYRIVSEKKIGSLEWCVVLDPPARIDTVRRSHFYVGYYSVGGQIGEYQWQAKTGPPCY